MSKHRKKKSSFGFNKINKKAFISAAVITFTAIVMITGSCGKAADFVESGLTGTFSSSNPQKEISSSNKEATENLSGGKLKVSFIDVGCADSILIEKDSHSMLIDAGTREAAENVINYLNKEKVKTIDYAFGTHPHEDHIGGLDKVIDNYTVKNLFMPNFPRTTATYKAVINSANKRKLKIQRPEPGKSYKFEGADFTILAPNSKEYKETNDYSIVIKLVYGNTSFLFTGDAQSVSEYEMINKGYNLKADVLKVGHHGSATSTTAKFLKAVSPKYAVISSANGEKNLPNAGTVKRIKNAGIKIYKTYECGTVTALSDGKNITFSTQKAA